MEEEQQQHEPKISEVEIILGFLIFGGLDAFEAALVFFGLDDFFLIDILAFPAEQIYLRMKGVKGTFAFIGNIIEVVPYLGWLPMRTVGWGATVWLDRHPSLKDTLVMVEYGKGASPSVSLGGVNIISSVPNIQRGRVGAPGSPSFSGTSGTFSQGAPPLFGFSGQTQTNEVQSAQGGFFTPPPQNNAVPGATQNQQPVFGFSNGTSLLSPSFFSQSSTFSGAEGTASERGISAGGPQIDAEGNIVFDKY